LSPPTSVVAAVTSRIAEASFMRTMMIAMLMCMPLMVMMGAVFTRPGLVVIPGMEQIPAFVLVLIGTLALSFVFQGRFNVTLPFDLALRAGLGLLAAVTIFHPDEATAFVFAAATLAMTLVGVWRFRGYTAAREA
jgi:TRAP-type uncharacterized transport system fused permease subunit